MLDWKSQTTTVDNTKWSTKIRNITNHTQKEINKYFVQWGVMFTMSLIEYRKEEELTPRVNANF